MQALHLPASCRQSRLFPGECIEDVADIRRGLDLDCDAAEVVGHAGIVGAAGLWQIVPAEGLGAVVEGLQEGDAELLDGGRAEDELAGGEPSGDAVDAGETADEPAAGLAFHGTARARARPAERAGGTEGKRERLELGGDLRDGLAEEAE